MIRYRPQLRDVFLNFRSTVVAIEQLHNRVNQPKRPYMEKDDNDYLLTLKREPIKDPLLIVSVGALVGL